MSGELHRIYTPGTSQEELTKQAEAELFTKLAAANGIDLKKYTDEQVQQLWDATFQKTAEFPPAEKKEEHEKKETAEEEKKEEEKKEAAAREHATKLAAAREAQNAYGLGELMAQGYVDRLVKLGMTLQPAGASPVATPAATGETKEAAMPPALAKALDKVKGGVSKGVEAAKAHPGKAAAGAAAATGAAGFAAGRMSKKGSAIDQLAGEEAVKIAHAAGGWDLDDVADKINAVLILGLQESTKLASTLPEQTQIRALELLEAAGYPVDWNQAAQ